MIRFMRSLALSLLLACTLAGHALTQAEQRTRNLVVFVTDDQRADALGSAGMKWMHTPHIDALARRGTRFDRAYCTTSICMVSRATLWTGQWASRHGIWRFGRQLSKEALAETYPALLRRAGYYTGFIGKWGVGAPPKDYVDYSRAWPGQNRYQRRGKKPEHLTELHGQQALEFLGKAPRNKAFCLTIAFKAPHCQDGDERQFIPSRATRSLYRNVVVPQAALADSAFFDAMPGFLRNSMNRRRWGLRFVTEPLRQTMTKNYARLISGVDSVVGQVVDKLRQQGRLEDTLIVFTSDHGFYLGDRGFAGKWLAHEVSMRVPFIVVDPNAAKSTQGQRRDELVVLPDLAPTLLDYAGVPVPDRVQGRSLRRLITSSDAGQDHDQGQRRDRDQRSDKSEGARPESAAAMPWRRDFLYEHRVGIRTIPQSDAVCSTRWKYIKYLREPPYEELYDLQKDPHEAKNLANSKAHAATLSAMRQRHAALRKAMR